MAKSSDLIVQRTYAHIRFISRIVTVDELKK